MLRPCCYRYFAQPRSNPGIDCDHYMDVIEPGIRKLALVKDILLTVYGVDE